MLGGGPGSLPGQRRSPADSGRWHRPARDLRAGRAGCGEPGGPPAAAWRAGRRSVTADMSPGRARPRPGTVCLPDVCTGYSRPGHLTGLSGGPERKQPGSVPAGSLAWRSYGGARRIRHGAAGDGPVRRTSTVWRIEADGRTADGRGIPAAMFLVLRPPAGLRPHSRAGPRCRIGPVPVMLVAHDLA